MGETEHLVNAMKFHIQRLRSTEKTHGSCYPTVYACLLDLELEEVPYFSNLYFSFDFEEANIKRYLEHKFLDGKSLEEVKSAPEYESKVMNYEHWRPLKLWLWDNSRELWLASKGYKEVLIPKNQIYTWLKIYPNEPYIASGKSPRGVDHVVIYQSGKMIHDPHPEGGGVEVKYYMALQKF
jgi:hypothetical protein